MDVSNALLSRQWFSGEKGSGSAKASLAKSSPAELDLNPAKWSDSNADLGGDLVVKSLSH